MQSVNIKVSIITCTLDSEKYLAQCLESVKAQTYKNIEHIFVDGESTDQTLNIIKKYYLRPIIISRKPQGIYDALNSGLELATGEVVGILHSDDLYYDKQCLARIADSFQKNHQLAYYCSKMIIHDENLETPFAVLGARPHKQTLRDQLYSSTYFAHPTYYLSRAILNKVGKYNVEYKIAADIDWLIRLEKLNLSFYFDNKPLIKFRSSGRSVKKYFLALREEFIIRKRLEGLSINLILVYIYHFARRFIRYILEFLGLDVFVALGRKAIAKFN